MSLRATGEGHISSIVFRRGIVDRDNKIHIDAPSPQSRQLKIVEDRSFEKQVYWLKLIEMGALETCVREDCIIASNTSTIPIRSIAEAAAHPGRVVGMHFFSPVHKMPLLEVIESEHTESWVTVSAVAFGRRMGKTVIVDHTKGYMSLYAHLKEVNAKVKVGHRVKTGTILGLMGDTGSLHGPRLYLEVRDDGRAIDPSPWFR